MVKNVKTVLEGTQIETTKNLTDAAATTFSFGNTLIVQAGVTKTFKVYADIITVASPNQFDAGDTILVTLNAGTTNAQGMTSLTTISTAQGTGRTLSVAIGTLAVKINAATASYTSTVPTGVLGGTEKKIASFVIVGGAGEGSRINQIVLEDNDSAKPLGEDYQNLLIKNAAGTQIGTTIGSLNTTASTYTFTPATTIEIAAGAQYVIDVFADIKSNATNTGDDSSIPVKVNLVSGTGLVTNSSTDVSPALALQAGYLSTAGALTITVVSDDPIAQQYVMGTSEATLAKFKIAASSAEAANISQVLVSISDGDATDNEATVRGNLTNLKLYDGTSLLASVASLKIGRAHV